MQSPFVCRVLNRANAMGGFFPVRFHVIAIAADTDYRLIVRELPFLTEIR
jgi:hypothetical protein